MSAELVMAGSKQPVTHNSLHDLESFFYVLVGICVLYSEPSKQKSDKELAECYDKLFNTFTPSILKTITIQSDLTWFPLVVDHISPYFRPLIPLLNDLRDTIIQPMYINAEGSFCRRTVFDHDMIIRYIVIALSSLGPEAWGDTFTLGGTQDGPEIPETGCDAAAPSQTPSKRVRTQASNLLAPPPLLAIDPPFPTFGHHVTCSDSGVYLGRGVRFLTRNRSGDPDDSEVRNVERDTTMVPPRLPKSSKRTEKRPSKPPLPPPSVPIHRSLLASGRRVAWSDSRLPLKRPHDSDSDEYVPSRHQKRARLSIQGSSQGPSTTCSVQDQDNIVPPRRSLRKPKPRF